MAEQKAIAEILALAFGISYRIPPKVIKRQEQKMEKRSKLLKELSK